MFNLKNFLDFKKTNLLFENNLGKAFWLYFLIEIDSLFDNGKLEAKCGALTAEKKHKLNFKKDKILTFLNLFTFKIVTKPFRVHFLFLRVMTDKLDDEVRAKLFFNEKFSKLNLFLKLAKANKLLFKCFRKPLLK